MGLTSKFNDHPHHGGGNGSKTSMIYRFTTKNCSQLWMVSRSEKLLPNRLPNHDQRLQKFLRGSDLPMTCCLVQRQIPILPGAEGVQSTASQDHHKLVLRCFRGFWVIFCASWMFLVDILGVYVYIYI